MPVFSMTAPIVTAEDEKRELDELTEEEALALRADVHGVGSDCTRTTESIPQHVYTEGGRLVEDAIRSMDSSIRTAYDQAREQAPELIERESPVRIYLEASKFDVWTVAENIVKYWKFRVDIFGADQAFLPMTLDGAMAGDMELLNQGVMMAIADDEHGRPVHFYDRARILTKGTTSRQKYLRTFFYLQQTRMEQPRGFVALVSILGFDLYKHYDRTMTKTVLAIYAVFPGELKALHVFTGSGRSVADLILPMYKHMYGKHLRMRCVIHHGTTQGLSNVRDYGLTEQHVDAVFGGVLKNQRRCEEWLGQRREIERSKHK